MIKKTTIGVLLACVLLLPAHPARAQDGTQPGKLVIGQNFTLTSGEVLDGDLVVIGGELDIEAGAKVKGDVVVVGGSLRLDGQTTGSAVVIGGAAGLGESAVVSHDIVTIGGAFRRAQGAHIGGDIITNLPLPNIELPTLATISVPRTRIVPFSMGPFGAAAGVLFQALGLAALGMLLGAFLHPQLARVSGTISRQPMMAGSVGLLAIVGSAIAILVLAITLILIPVALAVVFLLVIAWLFGVVALGMTVGDRISRAVNRRWEPVVAAGVGSFTLAIAVGLVNAIPCVGWLAPVVVGLLALGAAVITVLGTRAGLVDSLPAPAASAETSGTNPA
jgi:hypothetical protein